MGGHSANLWLFGTVSHRKRQLRLMGNSRSSQGLENSRTIWCRWHHELVGGFLKILMPLKKNQNTYATRLLGLLRLQLDFQDKYAELVPRSIVGLHRFFKIYVKGFPGASDLRAQLMNTKSTDEVRQLLATFEVEHGVLD